MKRFASILLIVALILSVTVAPVSATEASGNWNNGTLVSFDAEADNNGDGIADSVEFYTVTVPAQLAPNTTGKVVLSGAWPSNRMVIVTADKEVVLENNINSSNTKTLPVEFESIKQVGDNAFKIEVEENVSVAAISNAIFGTWSGTFNYMIDIVDASNASAATVELKTELADYSWSEIQTIANSDASLEDYSIQIGDTITDEDGTVYYLVDDARNKAYGGLVFMFNSGISAPMNSIDTNAGGYVSSELKPTVDGLYDTLPTELQSAIKTVAIKANDGKANYTTTHTASVKLFLPSLREVSGTKSYNETYNPYLNAEGSTFDWFVNADTETANRTTISSSLWWLRSAYSYGNSSFCSVHSRGLLESHLANVSNAVVPAFVIGSNPATYETTFSDNSWDIIAYACQNNEVPDTWNVGDVKTMTIGENEVEIMIIGKNHDEYADGGGTAPLTFMTKQVVCTHIMNPSNTNSGSWDGSAMYTYLNEELLATMDMKSSVKAVKKYTNLGGADAKNNTIVEESADKLFLLSLKESVGDIGDSVHDDEGTQYTYFANGGSRTLTDTSGTAVNWWFRTPNDIFGDGFYYGLPIGDYSCGLASSNYGVAFGFCF